MILELNNMRIKPLNVRKKVTWYNRLPTNGYRTPKKGVRYNYPLFICLKNRQSPKKKKIYVAQQRAINKPATHKPKPNRAKHQAAIIPIAPRN